jgi:hypothetical protein
MTGLGGQYLRIMHFNKEIFDRTEYTLYCYNVCADFFYDRLMDKRNSKNEEVIDKIISDLNYEKNILNQI